MKLIIYPAYMMLGFFSALTLSMFLSMLFAGLHSLANGRMKRFGLRVWCMFVWAAVGCGIYFLSMWMAQKTGLDGKMFLIGGFCFPGLFFLGTVTKTASDLIREDVLASFKS